MMVNVVLLGEVLCGSWLCCTVLIPPPHVSPPGVRFPEDSVDDIQKQKQLLKDAAAFLVSCQIPSLVSFWAAT